jgi:hypothetical protein
MNNLVTVRKENGATVRVSNNPEYGFIVLEQIASELKDGWISDKTLTTIIQGKISVLESMDLSKPLIGKIVVKESLRPFNNKMPERDLKYAGDTGIVCMDGDNPIYRKTEFTYDTNAHSEFIKHTNGAEIRSANSTNQAVESLSAFKEESVEA